MATLRGLMSEADWEALALDDLGELAWQCMPGAAVAPGTGERRSWEDLVIPGRLRAAIARLNPGLPAPQADQALAVVTSPASHDAITENFAVHRLLTGGVRSVTFDDPGGGEITPTIRLISENADENEYLAVNQVTVVRGEVKRRFDIVLYLNGMPISVIELKNAGDRYATLADAHAQLQTYLRELPLAFRYACFTLITDGITAKYGTPFTPLEHFAPWNLDEQGRPADAAEQGSTVTAMHTAIHGLYQHQRLLDLLAHFTAFDAGDEGLAKRIAKPHQYFAVSKAVDTTVAAVDTDGRAGVVWHTQGSGKSMEMELYANRIIRHPRLNNPTVVVVTDRTELDGQLFDAFDRSELLPEHPRQITTRAQLRAELSGRTTGGIYFTTLQKFSRTADEKDSGTEHPELSARRNIIVIVDEAHRSHYDNLDGYARHLRDALPHATLIAFTGTPVSTAERDTRAVFGDYIDIYDLSRAVADGATVPVHFESRLVKVAFAGDVDSAELDLAADEATVGLDDFERERIERSVAVVNAVYGTTKRISALADDLLAHWQRRKELMRPLIGGPGKALIVCATRAICAEVYAAIRRREPGWHSSDIATGKIKVVYSGTPADPEPIAAHVRRDGANAAIKKRFKDVDDELELIIVKDMMLTGYDSPPLHTLYLDRPLRGALLMQTLARVNRTYRGKQDGLLVGYAPLADNLAAALAEYTDADRLTRPVGRPVEETADLVRDLLRLLGALLAGFDWRSRLANVTGGAAGYADVVLDTLEHLRSPFTPGNQVDPDDPDAVTLARRFRRLASQLSRAWALAGSSDAVAGLAPDARFFEEVRIWMAKQDAVEREASGRAVPADVQRLLRSLMDAAVESSGVVDIYAAAGMPPPDLSRLSPEFVASAAAAKRPHLAIEALRKLIAQEAEIATAGNVVRHRAFSDRLAEIMRRYTNAQLTSAEVIAALVQMAQDVTAEAERTSTFDPPLSRAELAFYDAVSQNESAVLLQGRDVLAQIARELVAVTRRDAGTDWRIREDVRARLRASVKRLLVKYRYPPDQQPDAIRLVIEQMEALADRAA